MCLGGLGLAVVKEPSVIAAAKDPLFRHAANALNDSAARLMVQSYHAASRLSKQFFGRVTRQQVLAANPPGEYFSLTRGSHTRAMHRLSQAHQENLAKRYPLQVAVAPKKKGRKGSGYLNSSLLCSCDVSPLHYL